ncbi:MAG: DNA-binding protein WhiA [Clostridiales bacterium]|jgi:DNA-binding protein WhiA|nr:DNA-binding protein WhiA [Clostridiales bacterium]
MISKRKVKEEIIEDISVKTTDFKALLYAATLSFGSLILSEKKLRLSVEAEERAPLAKFAEGLKKEYGINASFPIAEREKYAGNGSELAGKYSGKAGKFTEKYGKKTAEKRGGKFEGKRLELSERDTLIVLKDLAAARVEDGRITGFLTGLNEKYRSGDGLSALLQAAFLRNGIIRTPDDADGEGGYYAEVVFEDGELATDVIDELEKYDIRAKLLERNETYAVYIKDGESVGAFLALIKAFGSALALQEVLVLREERNNANRRANCDSHNLDKSAEASVRQVLAITKIAESARGLNGLSAELRATAVLRAENKTASIAELAGLLGVSKGCVQHRLKKLTDMADKRQYF